MKNIMQWHRVAIIAVLSMICNVSAGAYDFSVSNIYYNINDKTLTAEVTYADNTYNSYSGQVVIPATVTYNSKVYNVAAVGENAFRDCSGLTKVTFGSNVEKIGKRAFLNCSGLTAVTITEGVAEIGDYAFAQCGVLKTVTLNNATPLQVGNGAFMRCSTLKYMKWQSCQTLEGRGGLASVGTNAFAQCTSLVSIQLPGVLEHLGTTIFDGCTKLTNITVTTDQPLALSGDPFALDGSVTIYVPSSGQSGVSASLYQSAMGWRNYHIVELPYSFLDNDGYTYLKTSATTVALAGSQSSPSVIVVRNSITGYNGENYYVTSISDRAFKGTTITTLNTSNAIRFKAIGTESFAECANLATVTIPEGVTSIGERAFASCTALKTIKVPSTLRTVSNGAFDGCTSLKTVTLLLGVSTLSENAFAHCTSLTSLSLPSSITCVEPNALKGSTALKKILVDANNPYYVSVEGVLYELKYGEEYEPEQANELSKLAFYPASKTGEVLYIPPGVTEIKAAAVQNVSQLKKVAIPPTTTVFGANCFDGTPIEVINYRCTKPTNAGTSGITATLKTNATLQVPVGTVNAYKALSAWKGFKTIIEQNDVYSNDKFAFDWNSRNAVTLVDIKLAAVDANGKVSLPLGMTLNGRSYVITELKNTATAQVSQQVKILKIHCDSLSVIDLSNDLNPLAALTVLESISINANNPYFKVTDNIFFNKRGNILYCYLHSRSQEEFVLPNMVDTIMPQAFSQNKNLKVLTANNLLKYIGNKAFDGCTALQVVNNMKNVTYIGYRAFYGCTALTTFNGGENLTTIDREAFYSCRKLRHFPFSHGMITSIGIRAFRGCISLKAVVLGNMLTTIGDKAFENCTALTKVLFTSELSNFGDQLFKGCTSLSELWLNNTVPPQVASGFVDTPASVTLYVPHDAVNAYRTASPWSSAAQVNKSQYLDIGPDVNNDKVINSYDVTLVYSALLGDIDGDIVGHCDVNNDGAVTAADITIVYSYILNGDAAATSYHFVDDKNEGLGQYVEIADGNLKIMAIDHNTNDYVTSGLQGLSDNLNVATITLGKSQGIQYLKLAPVATGYFTLVAMVSSGNTYYYRAFPLVVR